jgi:phosphatidylserine decarboxylase
MRDRLAVFGYRLLPKRALTELLGRLARARAGRLTTAVVRGFIARYGVEMADAMQPAPGAYKTFNDFFTRALRHGARPLAAADLVSPVDGAIASFGALAGDRLVQAKGHSYSTLELLGGDAALAARFAGGHFATLYLSPKDYHRVHMPCAGRLVAMVHVPGRLYPVNPATARALPGLYARNERVVCVFENAFGPWVQILVGATIVGSIATVWHGVVSPPRPRSPRRWTYEQRALTLQAGDEMGRFQLGSTVVLLFPAGPLAFDPAWAPGRAVRMGEAMAMRR